MKNMAQHYTVQQLNLLLDGRTTADEDRRMREHLSACASCRLAFENLSSVDTLLQKLPLLEIRPDFTQSLMARILGAPKQSLAFRLLEKLSYVFGLLIVLGIMIASFILTGVFDTNQIDQTKSVATGIADKAGEGLASSIGTFTAWLVQYLPFAFGKGSMSVAFFAFAIVLMLAVVDKVVGRRILQR